ncbi:MAG: polyprenyl synthetase family protein [Planctomycetota bacterium]
MTALKDVTGLARTELERVSRIVEEALIPEDSELRPMLDHVRHYRGKQLRPALVILVAKALGEFSEAHLQIAAIVEMIHTATLVHDDILDGALMRRKLASLNAMHGADVSVLVGDYIYAKAFHMSVSLPDQRCSRLLAEVTRVICHGEITQMLHRFDPDLSERKYLQIIGEKTAVLYGAASELGALYGGASEAQAGSFRDFGYNLGLAFQIIDDCLDIEGEEAVVGKSLGTDCGKGKLTMPLIRLLRDLDGSRASRFRKIFLNRSLETATQRQELLATEFDLSAGLVYAHEQADKHLQAALGSLEGLPPSDALESLRSMADFVLCRRT